MQRNRDLMALTEAAEKATECLKTLEGLGKCFIVLSQKEKEIITKISEGKNIINRGVADALSREITIAFSHNEKFRPPPCAIVLLSCNGKIVGEMADGGKKFYNGVQGVDKYILPPVPFPELDGKFSNVCSASPGYGADKFLRKLIKVEQNDATLLVGFNIR